MPNVKYRPPQGFPASVNFQTAIGLISLSTGDNDLSKEFMKELKSIAAKGGLSPWSDAIDFPDDPAPKSARSTQQSSTSDSTP